MQPTPGQREQILDALQALQALVNFAEPNESIIQDTIDDPAFEGTRIKEILEMSDRQAAIQAAKDYNTDALFVSGGGE